MDYGALTRSNIPGICNEDICVKLQMFGLHGQSKDAFVKAIFDAWEYDTVGAYYKCNMTDIEEVIGLKQFEC